MKIVNGNYKYRFKKIDTKEQLEQTTNQLLEVVADFVKEKQQNNINDDFNEYKHNKNKFSKLAKKVDNQELTIFAYYIEDRFKAIATAFFILERNASKFNSTAEMTCVYINKNYRGIGSTWLKNIIFPHLKSYNIQNIYVKSSHKKAFSFYEKFGRKVGTYCFKSDNNKYERLGNIYLINI